MLRVDNNAEIARLPWSVWNAITGRYPALQAKIAAPPDSSVDAAVAAATRTVLLKLMPSQGAAIDADYEAALKLVPDGPAKSKGIAVGEQAATACLARADDATSPDTYRPHTTPGVYVPTVLPAVPNWGKRKPWVLSSGAQLRPGPPPSTRQVTPSGFTVTCVIAPVIALLPQEICAPSKAGPAAAEVAASWPPRARTISPLVPTSRAREIRVSALKPSATITPTVSAPTKAEMSGSVSTTPFP